MMFREKTHLFLDMNGTFMFNQDRFGDNEDYYQTYKTLAGSLSRETVNEVIRSAYQYLAQRYPLVEYRECFPTVKDAIDRVSNYDLSNEEIESLVDVFAQHEIGDIPLAYQYSLKRLHEKFTLALVIDIWAPKQRWLELFNSYGLWHIFSDATFSSDLGIVKPSPIPMAQLINRLQVEKGKCLVIGDSVRRDLGAARAAGLDCVIVGKQRDDKAMAHFIDLIQLTESLI